MKITKYPNNRWTRKILILSLSLLLSTSMFIPSPLFAEDRYEVDPVHSSIVFRIGHLGISFLYGRFNDPSGSITIDEINTVNNFARFTVKAENIDTNNEKRDNHLRGEDFFDVKKYPEITFVTRSFKVVDENTYAVTGDIGLHGVTRPVDITVKRTGKGKDPWGKKRIGYETSFTILRSDFGMDYMPDLVGNEVELMIAIEAILQ